MSTRSEAWVKICGITQPDDARLAAELGADAIGLNFVPSSRRYITPRQAAEVVRAVRGRLEIVGVFADESIERIRELSAELGLDWVQLHGNERPEALSSFEKAFKAVGVRSAEDVASAARFLGERLLVDAKTDAGVGGTGQTFDWGLVARLCAERSVIVAGGLTPENVAEALERLPAFGVDVASGVEPPSEPRRKDPERMRRFVENAKRARRCEDE
jgi:phosphoribosylanthranilate isomerase